MTATTAKGHRVGYIRVSTAGQSTARQDDSLDGLDLDKVFTDHASGRSTDRPALREALAYLRKGDELVVHSMDRLARSLKDLLTVVDDLVARGVTVRFVKEGLVFGDEADPCNRLLLQMLGAVAEFERSLILERQREGIEIAKSKGVYKGRKPSLTDEQAQRLAARLAAGESAAALGREYGVSKATVYATRDRVSAAAEAVTR